MGWGTFLRGWVNAEVQAAAAYVSVRESLPCMVITEELGCWLYHKDYYLHINGEF